MLNEFKAEQLNLSWEKRGNGYWCSLFRHRFLRRNPVVMTTVDLVYVPETQMDQCRADQAVKTVTEFFPMHTSAFHHGPAKYFFVDRHLLSRDPKTMRLEKKRQCCFLFEK